MDEPDAAELHTPLLYDDVADAADAALSAGLDAEAALAAPHPATAPAMEQRPRVWFPPLGAGAPLPPLPESDDELASYGRMGAVLSLMLCAYALARVCAVAPFPDDATGADDGGQLAADVFELVVLGTLLTWLTGLTRSERFAWFRARPLYALVFLGTGPVFAAIGQVPGLQISLANVADWGGLAWLVMLVAGAAVAVVVYWHARHAARVLTWRPRLAYLASRSALVLLIFVLWLIMTASPLGRKRYEATHLHHWLIGFVLASWGAFNHPISATLLAVGAGIFVQGIGAYGFAWLFYATPAGQWAAAASAGCVRYRGNASFVTCGWEAQGANVSKWGVIMCPMDREPLQGSCVAAPAPPPPPRPPLLLAPPPWPPWPSPPPAPP